MRQLWSTGWLHNRIRVVCASFLVKNLLLPWQWGLKHYWDALLDADLECAALGWQYCSGCLAGEGAGSAWGEGWSAGCQVVAVCGVAYQVGPGDWRCMVCNLSCRQHDEVLPTTGTDCESGMCFAAASLHPASSCAAWAGTTECPAAHGNTSGVQPQQSSLDLSAPAFNL